MMLFNFTKNSGKQILNTISKGQMLAQASSTNNLKYNFSTKNDNNSNNKNQNDQNIQKRMQEVKVMDKEMQKKMNQFEMKIKASQFDEKQFVHQFNMLFSNYNLNKEEQAKKLIESLRAGLSSVTKIQTVVGVLDKAAKFNLFLSKEFEIQLVEHGLTLIKNRNYYDNSSDGGDLIRALTLVAGLKKIRHLPFYQEIVNIISKSDITKKNMLTIIETITYNKIAGHLHNGNELLPCLNQLKNITPKDLEIFAPLSNLICYFLKNKNTVQLYGQNNNFQITSEEIFKSIHHSLLALLSQQNPDSLDIFLVAEIQNHLEIFSRLSQKDEVLFIQRKFNNLFTQYLMRNFSQKTYYDYDKVLRYVKKFITAPPVALNPAIIKLIGQTYNSAKPNSLSEVVPFLYFLSKTVKDFKIPYESNKVIEDNLKNEKNIMILSKLMEIYATTNFTIESAISDLEQRIISLCSYSANPTSPLLIMFQSLTNMHRGQTKSVRYIVDYFKYPGVLNKIEFFDLVVKFIPSLAIKTKELYKFSTNMGFQSSANFMDEPNKIDPEFQQSLEELWDKVEALVISRIDDIYYDKYPTLLLHFLYANLMKNKYKRIFNVLQQRVVQYLDKYNAKQVSEVIYSYARMHEKNNDLFFKSIPIITKSIDQFNIIELINIYWGYANARIYDENLCQLLESKITQDPSKVSIEGSIQFFHSIGIYGRNIEKNSSVDTFVRQKIANIDSLKLSVQQQFALAYAFLVFNNRSEYSMIWENLLNLILSNQSSFISSPVYMSYLYQIYIHLRYTDSILLPSMPLLLQVLIKNRETLIRFFKVNKRYFSSDIEKKITAVIEEKVAAPQGEKKNFTVEIKHDIPLVFYDDLRELDQNTKFPESELVIPYTLDCRKGALCFEVNGPQHYLTDKDNNHKLDGVSLHKKNFLEMLGFKYVEIMYEDFTPEIVKDEALFNEKVMSIIKAQLETMKKQKSE